MTPTDRNPHRNATAGPDAAAAQALAARHKVVLVMGLVESVRLMAADELTVIVQWRGILRASESVLPRRGARLVKSLGDGIMAEFDSASEAAAAALALQGHFSEVDPNLPPDRRIYLHPGLHAPQVYIDDIDIFGSGANLAARVAGLAGPGETLVTAEVRDQLTDGLHGARADLGDCCVEHLTAPVRAYRHAPSGNPVGVVPDRDASAALKETPGRPKVP